MFVGGICILHLEMEMGLGFPFCACATLVPLCGSDVFFFKFFLVDGGHY